LDCSPNREKQLELLARIIEFVGQSSGLKGQLVSDGLLLIEQKSDRKSIPIHIDDLDEVLFRSDTEGRDFIQVNFCSGKKILITDRLIGFKPVALAGLDLAKLPRVVTTPDILSVFEAIQEALHVSDSPSTETAVLRRVFDAVIAGGEAVGFDLTLEKSWIKRIPSASTRFSA
jgi:hypothetical protein